MSTLYAPAAVRDRFLASLDSGDWKVSASRAVNLTACGNPLPGATCTQLGLPMGSTYAAAARHVLSRMDVSADEKGH
jgi:hypothetical protein